MASTPSNKQNLRSPLSMARGLGSAKYGTEHWWHQRLIAIALIPLTLWFVLSVIAHLGASYEEFAAWMRSPFSAVMMILTVALTFHHAQSGMQVVYEDYLHVEWQKMAAIIATKFLCFVLAAAAIFAVLKISFGA
jgi:succinate dehydrogenase / fumarate reductase membrane anchor subunit